MVENSEQEKNETGGQSKPPELNPEYWSGYDDDDVPAPPRILLWGVVGLFILCIIGAFAGIYIFREVLTPGRQVRVIGILPFMEEFLPSRPDPYSVMPTVEPVEDDALQMLNNLSVPGATATQMPEMTIVFTPTAVPTIEPTATIVIPTEIPTATPVPDIGPTVETSDVNNTAPLNTTNAWPANFRNYGFRYEEQTWNNCGPANITMALSYYGWLNNQEYAAERLKPQREDNNVGPDELVDFANDYTDVRALTRMGGDLDLLRILVANEFPVIVERGHMFEGYDWLGHYQTIVGYDDAQRGFYILDSYLGRGENPDIIFEDYDALDSDWRAFNRTFIVVYHPSSEGELMRLLGDRADPMGAARHALDISTNEANTNPQDGFAWFNMGTSLTELGRYQEATTAFDYTANLELLSAHWRMTWYQFAPFEAYFYGERYDDVLGYVNANLSNNGKYAEETYYWQGMVYAVQGNNNAAREAFNNALGNNHLFTPAQEALDALN
jgi:tetratricopeptide (TPR) repeat protein